MEDLEKNKRADLEKKDSLWIKYHKLFDSVIKKSYSLDKVISEMLNLALKFLEKYSKEEDLKEIIIAFENLKNNILYYYGKSAVQLYEHDKIGNIMEGFDSLIFESDYKKQIDKLKNKLSKFT